MEERAKPGVHFGAVLSSMSNNQRDAIVRGLTQAGALDFLEQHPLRGIWIGPRLVGALGTQILGRYVFEQTRGDYQTAYVNATRPRETFGKAFAPGRIFSVSYAGRGRLEAMKRTLVHELGHHVLNVAGLAGRDVVVQSVGSNKARPITFYAAENIDDYFAECFSAYVFHQAALQGHDPEGYNVVRQVRQQVGMR